ncbi:MAG: Flp family type IVb pilin [Alphaproteobacteria bacterium]|nr:Flp family type IVb pilin [Alphaproteobacteria bacterium]
MTGTRTLLKRLRSQPILRRLCAGFDGVVRDASGATAIEYALIVVFISILAVSWAAYVGTHVVNFFTSVNTSF